MVKELRALLEQIRAKDNVPALAAGIVHGDRKPLVAAVGVRKRGTDNPVTAQDEWHLGSNTKPMTALLIAILIELGLLDWNTPLEDIFPDHAGKWGPRLKKITPAHLLTHTAGLPSRWEFAVSEGSPAQQRAKLVNRLSELKLESKPGDKFQYANLGYVLLGAIVDKRGKASWEEQLETRIFRPLGMKHWGLGPVGQKDAVVQPWPHGPDGEPRPRNGDNPPVYNSAGRVHMSVADYNRYLAETLKLARGERGLLKPATARHLFTNPYPVSPHSLSGWGGYRKQPGDKGLVLKHDGSNTSNYCTAVLFPDSNLAVCVLSNQAGPGQKACAEVRKQLVEREKR
jgi:CubicO group peptidase (beta-lactamase class C family)